MARIAKKKPSFGTSMGVSSIIAILVILVLVVFSALSIATSKADLTLSQKSSASIKAFYTADATAEDRMAEIAAAIAGGGNWQTALDREVFTLSPGADGTNICYTVPVDVYRDLRVELLADTAGNLTRNLWQVVPAREWVADESFNLYVP